jgi:hypothetical protein
MTSTRVANAPLLQNMNRSLWAVGNQLPAVYADPPRTLCFLFILEGASFTIPAHRQAWTPGSHRGCVRSSWYVDVCGHGSAPSIHAADVAGLSRMVVRAAGPREPVDPAVGGVCALRCGSHSDGAKRSNAAWVAIQGAIQALSGRRPLLYSFQRSLPRLPGMRARGDGHVTIIMCKAWGCAG